MGIGADRPVVSLSNDHEHDTAPWLIELAADAAEAAQGEDPVAAAGELAAALGQRIPRPGEGRTQQRWEALATLGSVDLTVARTIEPHVDALAILAEAGQSPTAPAGLLGVYAAEGPGAPLAAHPATGVPGDDDWLLTGTKAWCSLADRVAGFLVTAWIDDERRGLFLVDLETATSSRGSFTVDDGPRTARGLSPVRSSATTFEDVPATPVGGAEWYVHRPGSAWGRMGVAAVWFGGAVSVAREIVAHARARPPDQISLMHVGRTEAAVHRARCVLTAAAEAVDAGRAGAAAGERLALTVRAIVREAAEEILTMASHAMGPAPLVTDEEHAARVAGLHVYLRQEHAERDVATLGRSVLAESSDRPAEGVSR